MAHEALERLKEKLYTPELDARVSQGPEYPVKAKLVDLRTKANKIMQDSEKFTAMGIAPEEFTNSLNSVADALESATILYNYSPEEFTQAEEVMSTYDSDILKETRAQVFSRLNFLCEFKGHDDLRSPLKKIAEGDDVKDTILDLSGCFELAQHKSVELAELNYGEAEIAELGKIAQKVAKAYPMVKSGNALELKARELRNRVYWYCVDYERKLREAVFPMVFCGDSSWRQRYSSDYR